MARLEDLTTGGTLVKGILPEQNLSPCRGHRSGISIAPMSELVLLRVCEVVAGPRCVDTADGQRVHDKIAPLLRNDTRVVLSFDGISLVIAAFLNAAIGQIYGEFPEERVDSLLEVRNLLPVFQTTLDKSREWSKAYVRDPERFKRSIREVMGDEE